MKLSAQLAPDIAPGHRTGTSHRDIAPGHRTGIPAQPNLCARPRGVAQEEATAEPVAWPCDLW
jgi:hypothetical protein